MARVCVDSTYFSVNGSGLLTFNPASVGIQQTLVFDTAGSVTNFTKATYPGLRKILVRAIGGGGGGAGAQAVASQIIVRASGGGGGYSESLLDAASIGASESVSVGIGGAAGVGNNPGGVGGQSSFGGFVIANGGNGSTTTMASGTTTSFVDGALGGALGTGQIRAAGQPGGNGTRFVPVSPAIAPDYMNHPGGASGGGYGAGGNGLTTTGSGNAGIRYGGGGSGAIAGVTSQNGGAGASGAVILTLFF